MGKGASVILDDHLLSSKFWNRHVFLLSHHKGDNVSVNMRCFYSTKVARLGSRLLFSLLHLLFVCTVATRRHLEDAQVLFIVRFASVYRVPHVSRAADDD